MLCDLRDRSEGVDSDNIVTNSDGRFWWWCHRTTTFLVDNARSVGTYFLYRHTPFKSSLSCYDLPMSRTFDKDRWNEQSNM